MDGFDRDSDQESQMENNDQMHDHSEHIGFLLGLGVGDFSEGERMPGPRLGDGDYTFTVSSGAVTAVNFTDGDFSRDLTLRSDESFTVGTGSVTETITLSSKTETLTYLPDPAKPGSYILSAESTTFTAPDTDRTYSFTLTAGGVTGVSKTITHGDVSETVTVTPPSDAAFTIGTGTITETWVSGDEVKTITYTRQSGATSYVVTGLSATLVPEGTATTALDVVAGVHASFTTGTGGDITAAKISFPHGISVSVTPDSTFAFTTLAAGYVEATVTEHEHTRFILFYDAAGKGDYTEIAHGSGTAVDLTGIKAQIAELPTALQSLI